MICIETINISVKAYMYCTALFPPPPHFKLKMIETQFLPYMEVIHFSPKSIVT